MAGDTDNTNVWLEGDVLVGPTTADVPTTPTSTLDTEFEPLGILGTEGLGLQRSQDSTDFSAWGKGVFRTSKKNHKRTFTVVALEDNPIVFDLVNPGSSQTTATGITTRVVGAPEGNIKSFVMDVTDGSTHRRFYVPRGEVDEVGDITLGEDGLESRELTIVAYFDTGIDGFYKDITNAAGAVVA